MKSSTIFWGVFLISAGLLLLANQMDYISTEIFSLWKLWPLLLIFWGVSLLKISPIIKKTFVALAAVFTALLLVSLLNFRYFSFFSDDCYDDEKPKHYSEKFTAEYNYDSTYHKHAKLQINGGAGDFEIKGTTDKLISVRGIGFFKEDMNFVDSAAQSVDLNLELNVFHHIYEDLDVVGEAKIKLNTHPIWDIIVKAGAVDFDMDLSSYKVSDLSLHTGASDVKVKLGALYDDVNVNVEAGAAHVAIRVPVEAACHVTTKTGLSGNNFVGFTEYEPNKYRSENYNKNAKKINIEIKGGLADFEISRY